MPVARGRRITDVRPQSAADGVGSLPLSSAVPVSGGMASAAAAASSKSTTTTTTTHLRGGRRITASGVEGMAEVEAVVPSVVNPTPSITDGSAPSATLPGRFKVPAAVLQRMQHHREQHHQHEEQHATTLGRADVAGDEQADTIHTTASAGASALPSSTAPATTAVLEEPRAAESNASAIKTDVSEADISATVAARRSATTHHQHSATGSSSGSRSVATDITTTPAAAAAAAQTASKPVIFSRQWRRQLFGVSAASSDAATPVAPSSHSADVETVLRRSRQHLTRRNGHPTSRDDVEEEEELDDDLLPFGKAAVVKFRRTEDGEGEDDTSGPDADKAGLTALRDAPTRRERHTLRVHAQERREQHRVHRHMAGFDDAFLARHEAQLRLHQTEDAEPSGGSSQDSGGAEDLSDEEEEEGGTVSNDSSAASDHCDEEGLVEDEDEDEEQGEGADNEDAQIATAAHRDSGGGFGAARRAEVERQQKRLRAAPHQAEAPSASSGPSTADGAATAMTERSLWFKSFFFVCHEPRGHQGGCHHTLMGLRGPVTVQGPCGIIGFGLGEVTVNGFYLGRKQLNLWHEEHAAVLMPMKRLKTRHAQDMELPAWPRVLAPLTAAEPSTADPLGAALYPRHYNTPGTGSHEGDEDSASLLASLQWECEAVFGAIDWDWVESMVQNWRNLFSNQLPPILLMVQPSSSLRRRDGAGPTRKFYLHGKRGRQGAVKAAAAAPLEVQRGTGTSSSSSSSSSSQAYMDVPSFVAHRSATSVDLALLPGVVPSVAAQGSGAVMVLGSANIGKSTLCRYLANVLLSQHGLCYWLDLDVGQPEFGVPGQLTLSLLRRPLLRAQDATCAEVVAAYFIGANTAAPCPLTAANALAAVCTLARTVAAAHPVVVNTHGWVLQTGRRVTVEALRRLRPRHVIHLCKGGEEAWAQDTDSLLDPRNGLNGEVVQRRFLVRHAGGTAHLSTGSAAPGAVGTKNGKKNATAAASTATSSTTPSAPALLCRLPYPHSGPHPSSPTQRAAAPESEDRSRNGDDHSDHRWRGQVHTVRVQREETFSSLERIKATKGSRGRQARWQTYFAALLRHYARSAGGTDSGLLKAREGEGAEEEEPETTLLEAPLRALHSIVLAERDEKQCEVRLTPSAKAASESATPASSTAGGAPPRQQSRGAQDRERQQAHAAVAAALEHAVVAVLFHACPSPTASGTNADTTSNTTSVGCVVRSLAALGSGFPVSCYGVVESTELELLHGRVGDATSATTAQGWIRIRVPLRPSVVAAMLASPAAGLPAAASASDAPAATWATHVSIAYSAVLRSDTGFVDAWR